MMNLISAIKGAQHQDAWRAVLVPHQAVLHLEHAGDPADGPGLERVLLLTAPVRFLTLESGGQSSSGDPFAGVSIDQAS